MGIISKIPTGVVIAPIDEHNTPFPVELQVYDSDIANANAEQVGAPLHLFAIIRTHFAFDDVDHGASNPLSLPVCKP
ncbi:MAG: hypothetical protein KBD24_01455 [Candidatus Pacebacteria bacterium]|nr:hypothetical protein [Candidatus Paceibacterota bacterium]